MASAPANNGKLRFRVRFGPYELDPNARVLRKGGTPVHLPEQPWQVLCALLERPGAVVTREELQERLWPGTFVDFEKSLNKVVNKLREALSDSADKPRFVETVVRQGYRFIAPVEIEFPSPSAAAVPDGISGSAVQPGRASGLCRRRAKSRLPQACDRGSGCRGNGTRGGWLLVAAAGNISRGSPSSSAAVLAGTSTHAFFLA